MLNTVSVILCTQSILDSSCSGQSTSTSEVKDLPAPLVEQVSETLNVIESLLESSSCFREEFSIIYYCTASVSVLIMLLDRHLVLHIK